MIRIKVGTDKLVQELSDLLELSKAEGYNFIKRLITEFENEENQFDRPGEAFYRIYDEAFLIGIGGINQDTYSNVKSEGRIRRFYIHPLYRRKGLATQLLTRIVEDSSSAFEKITLRTDSEAAASFYESFGFEGIFDSKFHTHILICSP